MDLTALFKDLHITTRRIIMNFSIIFCFMTIPFYLFKHEILNEVIYMQFFLVFCLAFVWALISMCLTTIFNLIGNTKPDNYFLESITLVSIVSLSCFILISYYYSDCFTMFLKRAFITMLTITVVPLTLGSLLSIANSKRKKK